MYQLKRAVGLDQPAAGMKPARRQMPRQPTQGLLTEVEPPKAPSKLAKPSSKVKPMGMGALFDRESSAVTLKTELTKRTELTELAAEKNKIDKVEEPQPTPDYASTGTAREVSVIMSTEAPLGWGYVNPPLPCPDIQSQTLTSPPCAGARVASSRTCCRLGRPRSEGFSRVSTGSSSTLFRDKHHSHQPQHHTYTQAGRLWQ